MEIEYLTECYIKAYEKALELNDDLDFAHNVAAMVVTILANQLRLQKQNVEKNFANLLKSIAVNNEKEVKKSQIKGGEN